MKTILLDHDKFAIRKFHYKANHVSICSALQFVMQYGPLNGLYLKMQKKYSYYWGRK